MMVRIKVEGLEGHWDVEIPEGHEFLECAGEKRDEGGTVGWDAVTAFEGAIRTCIAEEMTVEIIPSVANVPGSDARLRALCEGLEIQNIDTLFALGQVDDFRRLGERTAERIKEITHNSSISGGRVTSGGLAGYPGD